MWITLNITSGVSLEGKREVFRENLKIKIKKDI